MTFVGRPQRNRGERVGLFRVFLVSPEVVLKDLDKVRLETCAVVAACFAPQKYGAVGIGR